MSTGNSTPYSLERSIHSFAFSADGRYLASGSYEAACQIWDVSTQQAVVQLVGHTGDVCSIAYFQDGKQIVSASKDAVWDVGLLEGRGEMDGWQMNLAVAGDWILGPKKGRLFWTPDTPFRHTRNTLVIGKCLKIDFSNFVHGDKWENCRKPL